MNKRTVMKSQILWTQKTRLKNFTQTKNVSRQIKLFELIVLLRFVSGSLLELLVFSHKPVVLLGD